MSNELRALLARVDDSDPDTAKELRRHIDALQSRRQFGLNFERHTPESVALTGRAISVGDKVRFLPPRGETEVESKANWIVTAISGPKNKRVARLLDPRSKDETTRALEDLVFVADFRDPIYPGLVSTGKVERGGDRPFHAVINAENYHALEAMLFTHQGKVDCIYIDPPYNSGAKDWKYSNDYVDGDDSYRHSKWLAFMERRLKLARRLLNPNESVLILAIDENEVHRVHLLLEQIFPGSKVQMVTVLINPAGASIIDQFSRVDEHLLFVHIGTARPQRTLTDTTPGTSTFVTQDGEAKPFQWESFQRSGGNSRRQDTKAKFFPVWIHEETGTIVGCGDHLPEGMDRSEAPSPPEGCIAQWPIKRDGTEACWQLSAPTFRQYLKAGRIKIGTRKKTTGRWGIGFVGKGVMAAIEAGELVVDGRDEKGAMIIRNAEGRVRSQVGKTMWTNGSYSATEHGSTLLRNFLPRRKFPFPKSLYAVEDALRYYIGHKPAAVVLDFFSGSGTTSHAVMRLNRQDNGRRMAIAITNNEVSPDEEAALRKDGYRAGDPEWEALGICKYITEPRLRAAVTGVNTDDKPVPGTYRFADECPMSEGFEENVEFFTLTYENPALVELDMAFDRIAPLLWMRAGSEGRRIDERSDTFDVADTYAVLFNVDASRPFLAAVDKAEGVRVAYIVTDDETQYQAVAGQLPDGVESVRLYESYLRTFQINTGRA
ncbi:site-specific DNA-methyltransferase [Georgenia sp. TF02-10]|uniref:DNA methyltransferase n=1 Tax=Georgenia sp. TF02-10 TaxID=2917725 RepID=UPI001FA6E815|nr:DNA methyltransferase [Georgenia sp. TF02-10]UNX54868.1 site-specific DNA-methyltransferase [Georgenia sp. TF02-10]